MYTITVSGKKIIFSYSPIFVILKFSFLWLLLLSLLLKFKYSSIYKISNAGPWIRRHSLTFINGSPVRGRCVWPTLFSRTSHWYHLHKPKDTNPSKLQSKRWSSEDQVAIGSTHPTWCGYLVCYNLRRRHESYRPCHSKEVPCHTTSRIWCCKKWGLLENLQARKWWSVCDPLSPFPAEVCTPHSVGGDLNPTKLHAFTRQGSRDIYATLILEATWLQKVSNLTSEL